MWAKAKKIILPLALITTLTFNLLVSGLLNPQLVSAAIEKTLVESVSEKNSKLEALLSEYNKSTSETDKQSKIGQMKKIAAERKTELRNLIKTQPSDAKVKVLDGNKYPGELSADIEKLVAKKGKYSFAHGDPAIHILTINGGTPQYLVLNGSGLTESFAGSEVAVTGYEAGDYFLTESVLPDSSLQAQGAQAVTGTRTMAVFYVTFTNNRQRQMSLQYLTDYMRDTFGEFVSKSSEGRVNMEIAVYQTGFDLPIAQTCNLGEVMGPVTTAAVNELIDINSYQNKMVILDSSTGCGGYGDYFSGWANSGGTRSVVHEFGHNIGFGHAFAYDCNADIVNANCYDTKDEYGNIADPMGRGKDVTAAGSDTTMDDYGPYYKEFVGWFHPSEVVEVTSNSTKNIYRYNSGGTSTKVLKIPTLNNGPYYYVYFKDHFNQSGTPPSHFFGPSIELSKREVELGKKTFLLDMTPDSSLNDIQDTEDSYLHDQQEFTDPFNGITIKSTFRDEEKVTLDISFSNPSLGLGELSTSFSRPEGHLAGAGQKQEIDWSDINYRFSHRCTQGYLCDPNTWTDTLTTDNFASFTVASSNLGYQYEYKVDVITLKDTNYSEAATYPWVNAAAVSNTCGGATSCTQGMYWDKIDYRTNLFKISNGSRACVAASGACIDQFTTEDSEGTFLGVPPNVDFKGDVRVRDINNAEHFVKEWSNLGTSEVFTKSCTSNNDNECTIGYLSFIGGQAVTYSAKLINSNGVIILGVANAFANSDGSFNRSWNWDYEVNVFPESPGVTCASSGGLCQKKFVFDSSSSNFNFHFTGLVTGQNYRINVCAIDCDLSGNNPFFTTTAYSSGTWGPDFFNSNNFSGEGDSDGDGCIDSKETGPNKLQGGQRDPYKEWDFADMPVPALKNGVTASKNKAISISDVGAILSFVGTRDEGPANPAGYDYDSDFNANGIDDGREYDRTPSTTPGQLWRSGPPNGAISIQDVGVALAQVGHNCN